MKYSLELQNNIIVVSADPYGQYSSMDRLKEQVLHLLASYKISDIKIDTEQGESIDFRSLGRKELVELIKPKETPKCPSCLSQMNLGRCYTKATFKGFLLWGYSSKDLVFENTEGEISTLIENGQSNTAYRCNKCQLTLIKE